MFARYFLILLLLSPINSALAYTQRELLISDRIYYVSTTGNDVNDGLTLLTAVATPQQAVNYSCDRIDAQRYKVQVLIAAGSYAYPTRLCTVVGSDTDYRFNLPRITGDTTTPSNVVINPTTGDAAFFHIARDSGWIIEGVKMSHPVAEIYAEGGARLYYRNVDFAATPYYQIIAGYGSFIEAIGNFSISGGAESFCLISFGGICMMLNVTYTITGTPAYNNFINVSGSGSTWLSSGATRSGNATGAPYGMNAFGWVNTGGHCGYGGANDLPGNVAGRNYDGTGVCQ